ncbi:ribosome biogenesis GTP-binding protein YihA/YsxC [Caminibacter pacificus]|uniref:Probable GTP-binding protein EngB n=1 Tax=Caminibacter pacificus TaxID=1424653 RepID=A0AAJ4UYN0_9BACT|nr:ribosome biogenesis GTP-binding protein YihA/YsxC [Caminibacter pacificus]QCI28239.1 YihA family ribosome biogenesis GTP-binding protein [Caminibacter pacificus]ROR41047.1 GTP-binding protein [Caminibacter pacificus]
MKVKFIKSAPTIKEAIEPNFVEVALLGRSNVGKSSFLNTFTNQKIAKVSQTPGKTKLINFFEVEDEGKKYVLVDLPGFGYAKVSKSMLKDWGKNLDEFLKNRFNIKLFIHLRDARHPDLDIDNNVDEYLKSFMRKDQQLLTVFTKIDKLKQSELAKLKQKYPNALFVSNLKKRGIDQVRKKINEILWGEYDKDSKTDS